MWSPLAHQNQHSKTAVLYTCKINGRSCWWFSQYTLLLVNTVRQALPCPPPPTRTNHQIELNEGFTNERARWISHLHHKPPEVCAWTKNIYLWYNLCRVGNSPFKDLLKLNLINYHVVWNSRYDYFANGTKLSNINIEGMIRSKLQLKP